MNRVLWIDLNTGISGDSFAAALLGLGVEEQGLIRVIKSVSEELGVGLLDTHTHLEFLPDDTLAHRLHVIPLEHRKVIVRDDLPSDLNKVIHRVGLKSKYASFVRRGLAILSTVEGDISQDAAPVKANMASLPIIGIARSPYQHRAPYQPRSENVNDGEFFIEIEPQYQNGLQALETFHHIFILSYLDRSHSAEIMVQPPWKDEQESYGVFATRSPNRPSPIGLTRVHLQRVEGNRVYTGPFDLFDGTPVLDIKPYIHTVDGMNEHPEDENDGWLEGSDHLELHRMGTPHVHPESSGNYLKSQVFIPTLFGIGWGLQQLSVDITAIKCTSPVIISGDHLQDYELTKILEKYAIPYETKQNSPIALSLSGAIVLAALSPQFIRSDQMPSGKKVGLGLGAQNPDAAPFGALKIVME